MLASRNNSVHQQNELKEQQAYIDTVLAGKASGIDDAAVLKELKAQYPEAEKIVVGRGLAWNKAQTTPVSEQSESRKNAKPETDTFDDIVVVSLEFEQPLSAKDHERIQAWLSQRYEGKVVRIFATHKSQTDKPSNE